MSIRKALAERLRELNRCQRYNFLTVDLPGGQYVQVLKQEPQSWLFHIAANDSFGSERVLAWCASHSLEPELDSEGGGKWIDAEVLADVSRVTDLAASLALVLGVTDGDNHRVHYEVYCEPAPKDEIGHALFNTIAAAGHDGPPRGEATQLARLLGTRLMADGRDRNEVMKKLEEIGCDAQLRSQIVDELFGVRQRAMRDAGRHNMLVGGLICAVGVGITAVTYAAALGGGVYILAWGAILVGLIQFARGVDQYFG